MSGAPRGARSYALEGLTIVVGILSALVLGELWGTAVDRLDEREALDGLRTEFEAGRAELASDREARRTTVGRLQRLLEVGEGRAALPDDSVAAFTAALLDYRYYTPSHPVLDDLIAGGRLQLLRSDTLRRAILDYLQEKDRIAVVEDRERRFVSDRLEPWIADHLALEPPRRPDDPELWGPDADADALRAAAADPRFRTLVVLRLERTGTALRFSSGLARTLDATLAALGPSD